MHIIREYFVNNGCSLTLRFERLEHSALKTNKKSRACALLLRSSIYIDIMLMR